MRDLAAITLLLTALALPVVLFWALRSSLRWSGRAAAALAIGVGWAANLAYAFALRQFPSAGASQAAGDSVAIAAGFGWVCPSILIFLSWLAWRLATRRNLPDRPGSDTALTLTRLGDPAE